MFFRNGDDLRQIFPPDHDVNVTSQRSVRRIGVFHMEEYGDPATRFVRHTALLQWRRQLPEGAD